MDELFTCDEVAQRYVVPISTVRKWIREKRLRGLRIGHGYRIRKTDLEIFERNCATKEM